MNKTNIPVWMALALCLSGSTTIAEADAVCREAKSAEACFEEGFRAGKEERRSQVDDAAREVAARAETSTVADPAERDGTLTNFLSPFLALVDTEALGEEGAKLGLETAVKILNKLDRDVKFQLVFNEPKLFQPLRTQLSNDMLAQRADSLEKTLDDIDDLTLTVSWSPVNEYLGRSLKDHDPWFKGEAFEKAVVEAMGKTASQQETEEASARRKIGGYLQGKYPPDPGDESRIDFSQVSADDRRLIFEAGRDLDAFNSAYRSLLDDYGLFELGKLLNNQPQLIVSGVFRIRNDELAGPDEQSISVKYEGSRYNLNSLRRYECPAEGSEKISWQAASNKLPCYRAFWDDNKEKMKKGERYSFKLEYSNIEDVSLTIPGDGMGFGGLDFAHAGGSSVSLSAGWGRYVRTDNPESARVDFSLMGKWFDNDTSAESAMAALMERQDRLIASLTYTQRLNDELAAVVGVTWADNPEFLGDVTQRVGARLGLTYRIQENDS